MKEYSVKSIRENFKKQGIFYTPPELARYIKSLVDIEYSNVYDPTCGAGNLLSEFEENIPKYGQDVMAEAVEWAKENIPNFTGAIGDTLKEPHFMDMKFDLIVANPPFSVSWEEKSDIRFENAPCLPPKSKADYAFILHILHLLNDNGMAVVMEFPGILYRKAREGKIRRWLVEQNYIDKVIAIPGKKFTDTAIATCILVLKKNRTKNFIEFEDIELELSRQVDISEIAENDYSLNVNNYVQKEVEKEEIDPIALEYGTRELFIKRTKNTLAWHVMIAELEGIEIQSLFDGLRQVINEAEMMMKPQKGDGEMDGTVTFTLRIPENKNKSIKELAEKIGVSQNALILLFIDMGVGCITRLDYPKAELNRLIAQIRQ